MKSRLIVRVATVGALGAAFAGAPLAATNQFRGVNWADQRDNFQSGVIYLSGLSSTDTYASASTVADRVVGQFVSKLGTNSVRLPVNEATATTFWSTYTGVIDVALTKGRVVLCYWAHAHGAKPANMTNFWAMWKKIVDKYGNNPNAYFEVFNEPSGYTKQDLRELYAEWLRRHPEVPHGRIILDGTGLAMNVPDIGSDSRFAKCLLAVHDYSMWGFFTSEQQWMSHLRGQVGNYADRTIMTEFGTPMLPGTRDGNQYDTQDYNKAGGTYFVHYFRGMTSQLREWKMGNFYWPGLRDNDWYSLTKRTGSGAGIQLAINNQSGIDRLRFSWTDTVASAIAPSSGRGKPAVPRLTRVEGGLQLEFIAPRPGLVSIRLIGLDGKDLGSHSSHTPADGSFSHRFRRVDLPEGLFFVDLRFDGERIGAWKGLAEGSRNAARSTDAR